LNPKDENENLPTRNPRTEVHIVLDRLRSAHNTGNIFRLADAVDATEIIACGYTPAPPHPKLAKTAMGADSLVPSRTFPDSISAINALRKEGVSKILAVETADTGIPPWEVEYEFPLALVFGNEALGVAPDTLEICDGAISLPMLGHKTSINVGNCAAVVLYSVAAFLTRRERN
jgi:tRNA G18 (ribose-2'-O)-methylase SpoU